MGVFLCIIIPMSGYEELFRGKKITVMGLGMLGRGVGDVEFLARCGAEVLVTDKKREGELAESIERLQEFPDVTFHLGGHKIEDFQHCDMVLKAAGVPLDSPEIAAARAANIPVYMSTALFAKYAAEAGAIVVGITGTRGKSTVTHMIHHGLEHVGKRSHLGGNVRGKSTLAMLPEIEKGDYCVLELDSWQLQGFGDLKISPHVAVFTNLMTDHLNYYPDMETYFADKAAIFRYQKAGDALVVGGAIEERIVADHPPVVPTVPPAIPKEWKLLVLGEHNRENAALAAGALFALGLSQGEVSAALGSFDGLEGRLQLVREIDGVMICNDNNATTPEATIAAIATLADDGKKVILIVGGADKSLALEDLARTINEHVAATVTLSGTGTQKLVPLLTAPCVPEESLRSAFLHAMQLAKSGDIILFSPAFASFGMFRNEYDRNDQFLKIVKEF